MQQWFNSLKLWVLPIDCIFYKYCTYQDWSSLDIRLSVIYQVTTVAEMMTFKIQDTYVYSMPMVKYYRPKVLLNMQKQKAL